MTVFQIISHIVETVITGRIVANFLHIVMRKTRIALRSQCVTVGTVKNEMMKQMRWRNGVDASEVKTLINGDD